MKDLVSFLNDSQSDDLTEEWVHADFAAARRAHEEHLTAEAFQIYLTSLAEECGLSQEELAKIEAHVDEIFPLEAEDDDWEDFEEDEGED